MHVTLFKKYIYRKESSFAFVVSLLIEPIKVDVHMSCTCTATVLYGTVDHYSSLLTVPYYIDYLLPRIISETLAHSLVT